MKPLLIFGYGNPGRGDDGLGPEFLDAVNALELEEAECQTDMQLQVEHVMDMQGRTLVLFVDADMSCQEPFEFSEITPEKDDSYTSHAMSPKALLHAYAKVLNEQPPASYLLRIRGEAFELGDELSPSAKSNLEVALQQLRPLYENISVDDWHEFSCRGNIAQTQQGLLIALA